MRRSLLFATLAGIASALAVLSPIRPAHAVPPGEIVLGDITVFRLRAPSGKLTALQRADAVQDRLTEVLSIPDLKEKDVSVQMTNYGPTIYVCKIKLLTINDEDGKAAGMTPLELAKLWAHRLAGVLPQVNIRLPSAKPSPTPSTPGNLPVAAPIPMETPAATPTPDAAPAPTPPATPMPSPTPTPAPTPMPTPTPTPAAPAAPATPA